MFNYMSDESLVIVCGPPVGNTVLDHFLESKVRNLKYTYNSAARKCPLS